MTSPPRIGSLCSGYGGLTLAVQQALGGEVAWHSEVDPAASLVLDRRWHGVPNLGDMTAIDWAGVEPVDVLEGGTPCQDVSHAGRRAGMRAGTRSGLWASMVDAIDVLRPGLVIWENVRGVLSAAADSDLERCPVCVGNGSGNALRALGRVLGDLADLGYDARWCGLRASDVGAAHNRFRVFVAAYPADLGHERGRETWRRWAGSADNGQPPADSYSNGRGRVEAIDGTDRHLEVEPGNDAHGRAVVDWGEYRPAIERWERTLGRPAPAPSRPNRNGTPKLSPEFDEWLMGLPAGWITDVPGVSWNDALKMCGNGVVPQQAAAAIRYLLEVE